MALPPKVDSGSYKIYFELDNTKDNTDKDLYMDIETYDGKRCTVSPINTDCPYARHV